MRGFSQPSAGLLLQDCQLSTFLDTVKLIVAADNGADSGFYAKRIPTSLYAAAFSGVTCCASEGESF